MSNAFIETFFNRATASSGTVSYLAVGAIIAVLVGVVAYLVVINKPTRGEQSWPTELAASKTNSISSSSDDQQSDTQAFRDVWEERRRRGITMPKSSSASVTSDGKPFGSSYYYAHNHLRAKGGYTDGLQPEDYTMNGPRLLSRNGQSVEKRRNINAESCDSMSNTQADENRKESLHKNSVRRVLNISKYLWDDPGEGVACIRIDQLPVGGSDSATITWGEVSVKNVVATLEGEDSLTVLVESEGDVDYQLRIPQLYGKVGQVKTIVKAKKRLLVKLQKKVGFLDKSNAKAWPHPQKKKM